MADVVEFVRIQDPNKPGGTLVLAKNDFDPKIHRLATDKRKAPVEDLDTTPGEIATVNVEEALSLIANADTAAELKALEKGEKASHKHKGGRKTVLEAIENRRDELAAGD